LIEVVGIALVTVVATLTLRELGSRAAGVISVFSAVMILGSAANLAADTLLGAINVLPNGVGDIGKCILKIVGIGYIGGMAESTCRELSSPSVALGVSAFARAEMLAVVAPYFFDMLDVCKELLL
jgi:hypothetical protein